MMKRYTYMYTQNVYNIILTKHRYKLHGTEDSEYITRIINYRVIMLYKFYSVSYCRPFILLPFRLYVFANNNI